MSDPGPRQPIVEIRDLRVTLGRGRKRKEVLHGIDFSLRPGEIVGIIGESGSGKSTLAKSAVGLVAPDSGTIAFDGAPVARTGSQLTAFRRRGALQYVFQDPLQSLNPDRSVFWSVAEPLAIAGISDDDAVSRAIQLAQLDPALADRLPAQLSGGQRQRVLIARALVTSPRAIFADEPVSALDASMRVQILELFRSLARDHGIAIGFISHDIGSVAGIADRIDVLFEGRIVESGSAEQVIRQPKSSYAQLLVGSTPSLSGKNSRTWSNGRVGGCGAASDPRLCENS